MRGYERAALTLNFVRALIDGGFADLHHQENWADGFLDKSEHAEEYGEILHNVASALRFMEYVLGVRADALDRVDFFTSHEALLLPYEEAQTRE